MVYIGAYSECFVYTAAMWMIMLW